MQTATVSVKCINFVFRVLSEKFERLSVLGNAPEVSVLHLAQTLVFTTMATIK